MLNRIKPSKIFLLSSLLFGLVYVFIIPPFQAPDEVHHLFKSYHVSKGYAFGEKTNTQRFGGYLPESLSKISKPFRPLRYGKSERTSIDTILKTAAIPLEAEKVSFLDFPNVAYYAPTGYLPHAFVIRLSRSLELAPLIMFYLIRIINLLFWILIVYFAIRIIPFHKYTMALLALLPASLVFHAGINPDAVTNAFSFLLIAYLLRLVFTTEPLRKSYIFLLIVSVIITVNKVVYAPIFLLGWLIPIKKFHSRKNYFLFNIGIFFFHLIILILWYNIANDLFIPYDEYDPLFREDKQLNPGVNPMAQLEFIINNPAEFAQIFFHSYHEIFPWTLMHYVGKFGWEGNYLPIWGIVILLISIIIFPLFDSNPKVTLKPWHRASMIGIALVMTLAFSVVIYMQWNPPGHHQISALAGRYFIPIFPLVFFASQNKGLNFTQFHFQPWIVLGLAITFNAIGVICVLERYYW